MSKSRTMLLIIIAILIGLFFIFDSGQYFHLAYLKEKQDAINAFYAQNRLTAILSYFFLYILITGLSLPGAAILTLAGGAIFGVIWGTVIVSFASTIGATSAFLVSRYLFRESVQRRFADRLTAINRGIDEEGAFYLFTLRLVPLFPFFIINLVMGLTTIKAVTFFLVSQAGMLAGTVVYVNAGTQLAKIERLKDILSPGLILSFALLGLFPLIVKKAIDYIRKCRSSGSAMKHFTKPDKFDRNIIVIGAGAAGLVASYVAAAVRAKVTLIERDKMGGDCLNTGCVPSKALIRSAKLIAQARRSKSYGIEKMDVAFDFADLMERVQRVIKTIEPHDSIERYTSLGVECITGEARITSPYSVEVNGRTLTTKNIIIATGARPFIPPVPGLAEINYLTSDTLWDIRRLPERLVVLGGGPIGSELTQCFARLGSHVTQVEMLPRILIREDEDVSQLIKTQFEEEGVDVLVNHQAKNIKRENGRKILVCENEEHEVEIEFDEMIVAVGRKANTQGFGLDELGISPASTGAIEKNDFLQTIYPNIYVCGDVAGPYQFTHTASHQAWYASVNALFSPFKKFKADYSVIPWATFTDPEVARAGLNELEAKEKNIPCEVTTYDISGLDRAIADEAAHGLIKVLTVPGKDKILGATIVSEHAGDLIIEFITAMKYGIGLNKILGTIHIYPTLVEANKFSAGNWKKAHAPETALKLSARFHAWRLG